MMLRIKRSLLFVLFSVSAAYAQINPFEVSVTPPQEGRLNVRFIIPEKHYIYADQVEVALNGKDLDLLSAPSPSKTDDPVTGESILVYTGNPELVYSFDDSGTGHVVKVSYLGCNDTLCFAPAL